MKKIMNFKDMMEAFLNSGGTLVCVFFYVFAGWIVATDEEQKAQKQSFIEGC